VCVEDNQGRPFVPCATPSRTHMLSERDGLRGRVLCDTRTDDEGSEWIQEPVAEPGTSPRGNGGSDSRVRLNP